MVELVQLVAPEQQVPAVPLVPKVLLDLQVYLEPLDKEVSMVQLVELDLVVSLELLATQVCQDLQGGQERQGPVDPRARQEPLD